MWLFFCCHCHYLKCFYGHLTARFHVSHLLDKPNHRHLRAFAIGRIGILNWNSSRVVTDSVSGLNLQVCLPAFSPCLPEPACSATTSPHHKIHFWSWRDCTSQPGRTIKSSPEKNPWVVKFPANFHAIHREFYNSCWARPGFVQSCCGEQAEQTRELRL